jgi:hypothetical protein
MSRGPGRVHKAILEALQAEPQRRFYVEELARVAYPDVDVIDRSQITAVNRVLQRLPIKRYKPWRKGGLGRNPLQYGLSVDKLQLAPQPDFKTLLDSIKTD